MPESSARQPDAWSQARSQMQQLEHSAGRMSSRWFLGNAGVIVAASLFLLTAIVLGGAIARMLDNAAQAHRAQTIQSEAGGLQDDLAEGAASARVYALSGDPELLRVHRGANKAVITHLNALHELLADDPDGLRLLNQTRLQIENRLKLYDALTTLTGRPISTGESDRLKLARLTTAQVSQLRQRASDRFTAYQNRVIDDMRLSMGLALVTGIASPLFGLVGIHLLRRERESLHARELQLELMHVQRLAIMGETSAMLAHEINQPLTAASNYLSVMRRFLDAEAPDKARAIADRVEQQIQRAASILRKLRRFIEKRETEHSLEAPEVLVEDAITLLGTMDTSVSLQTIIDENLPRVLVDRVQLQQVLVNLMRNAIEAMQGSVHRQLVLSMRLTEQHMIEVSLTDTGPGLAPDIAARLFQPFVSTKPSGMGVGLSICHNIISQHGGRIWAEANPEGGTIFRFTLPAAEERAAA